MYRHAGVPVPGQDRLAGMHADPHPDPGAGRPPVRGQRTLDVQRAQHRLRRAAERDEEPIPLHVHLMTAMRGDGRADQPPVLGQNLRIPVPQRLDQPRRALDIAEQERDQPTREPAHPPPPPPAVSRPRQQAGPEQAPGSAIGPPRLLLPPSLGPAPRASGSQPGQPPRRTTAPRTHTRPETGRCPRRPLTPGRRPFGPPCAHRRDGGQAAPPPLRNHRTYAKHTDLTGNPSAPERGNLRSTTSEIHTPGSRIDSAIWFPTRTIENTLQRAPVKRGDRE